MVTLLRVQHGFKVSSNSKDTKTDFCACGTKSLTREFASLYNRRAISLWLDKRILKESKLIGLSPQTVEPVGSSRSRGLD